MQGTGEDIKALFGQLRSSLFARDATELLDIVRRARALDPISYGATWIPYLSSFLGQDARFRFEANGLNELVELATHLPFACIALSLSDYQLAGLMMRDFKAMPELASVVALSLDRCSLQDHGALELAKAPHLSNLKALTLCHNDITPDGFEALFAGLELGDLQRLIVNYNEVGERGASALAQLNLPELRVLDLTGTQLGDEGMNRLLSSTNCARLQSLNVSYNALTDRGVGAGQFTALRTLDLSRNALTPDGVCAFFEAASMPCLQELLLSRVHVGKRGARVLARSTLTSGLRRLDLSHSRVGVAGLRHLYAPAVAWEDLEYLRLPEVRAGDTLVELLLESDAFTRLRELDVSLTTLSGPAVIRLVSDPRCESLRVLHLSYEGGDATTRAIAASPYLSGLEQLKISKTWISPVAHRALRESPCLSQRVRDSI